VAERFSLFDQFKTGSAGGSEDQYVHCPPKTSEGTGNQLEVVCELVRTSFENRVRGGIDRRRSIVPVVVPVNSR
jgi:hypothetical protein